MKGNLKVVAYNVPTTASTAFNMRKSISPHFLIVKNSHIVLTNSSSIAYKTVIRMTEPPKWFEMIMNFVKELSLLLKDNRGLSHSK